MLSIRDRLCVGAERIERMEQRAYIDRGNRHAATELWGGIDAFCFHQTSGICASSIRFRGKSYLDSNTFYTIVGQASRKEKVNERIGR